MKKARAEYRRECSIGNENMPFEEREKIYKAHLNRYISVIALLWVIWFFTGAGFMWPIYPTLGWGLGIVSHAYMTYKNNFEVKKKELDRESEYI